MQKLWKIKKYTEVSSTNDIAKEKSLNSDNLVIVADYQYIGRGRRGNKWLSLRGNLFFSQLLTPQTNVSDLAFVSSLSLIEAIKKLSGIVDISIKWPNDILIDMKKVAGILIEQTANEKVVIGVGVNICNHPKVSETSYPTTNIKANGSEVNKDELLNEYLLCFDKNYALCLEDFALVKEKWLHYAANLNNKIKVKFRDKISDGIFKGIDEQGLLLLEQENKTIKISTAEVFF